MKLKLILEQCKVCWLMIGKQAYQELGMLQFIEGVYQREYRQDQYWIREQITIRQTSSIAKLFSVSQVFIKPVQTPEHLVVHNKDQAWTASYHDSLRQLYEISGKRDCAFHPEKGLLLLNNVSYQKMQSLSSKINNKESANYIKEV